MRQSNEREGRRKEEKEKKEEKRGKLPITAVLPSDAINFEMLMLA